MSTQTAEAQGWIDALPCGEFFFASDVPGNPSVVHPLLSRLAASEDHPVQRQMRGLYVKAWHAEDPDHGFVDEAYGAMKLAGPGGGGAKSFALHRAGWTEQIPCRYDFVALGRIPTSPWPYVRFHRRSNMERAYLTWAEVTLLEAIRAFDLVECVPWESALTSLSDGSCLTRMQFGEAVRSDRLLRVSEREQCQPADFHRRMMEAADALTQRLTLNSA